jgi:hypothetical protein
MALEGFLQEFGLADIMQLVYFQKKTGLLNIEGHKDKITLSFINGNVTGLKTKSRIEEKRIGKILLSRGLIEQEELTDALKVQQKEAFKLGSIFVKQGSISGEIVREVVEEQIIDIIIQIFSWKEGRYAFVSQEVPVDEEGAISLDTQHLLMEGVRIVDELSVIEGKIEFDTVYEAAGEPHEYRLSEIEKEVLRLIDGESDVSTIISISQFEDFETAKTILSLQEREIIRIIPFYPAIREKKTPTTRVKVPFNTIVLGVFLIVITFTFYGMYDALNVFRAAKMNMSIERLKNKIELYKAITGQYPENLNAVGKGNEISGGTVSYKKTESGFMLLPSVPDKIENTDQDVY